MIKIDYVDSEGIKRRVGVLNPHDDAKEGFPLDVYNELSDYYGDMPETTKRAIFSRLWDFDLIEAQDFLASNAVSRYMQALKLALKSDATNAVNFITQLSLEIDSNVNSHKRHSKDS